MKFDTLQHSHRRYNLLTGEWVLVSPHRSKRPWQGQTEKTKEAAREAHDPQCYLCPGNERANGEVNPAYQTVYTFRNDFAALQPDVPVSEDSDPFLRVQSERGICKVICFSPYHHLTIPEMQVAEIESVIDCWVKECLELSQLPFVQHIQIFENKGAVMGCSNPHPHGQIWAQESVPVEPAKKQAQQLAYFQANHRTLLSDYLGREMEATERVVFSNEHFVALVPFWASWPFETMILPKRPMAHITEMTAAEKVAFADAYRSLTIRYDNLFEVSFPYSAGIHQAPFDGQAHLEWHWHMSFYPPLLRSATVKKFMVGYEMFANPQRDITAEYAADFLRKQPLVHYKTTKQPHANK